MKSERGSVALWVLGLSVLLLAFGGLALDYWRALALQRELAAIADSAAVAGASGIDEEIYRASGEVVLDPERSRQLVSAAVEWQGMTISGSQVDVDAASITVTLAAEIDLGLFRLLVSQDDPLTVRATSTAVPVLVP